MCSQLDSTLTCSVPTINKGMVRHRRLSGFFSYSQTVEDGHKAAEETSPCSPGPDGKAQPIPCRSCVGHSSHQS